MEFHGHAGGVSEHQFAVVFEEGLAAPVRREEERLVAMGTEEVGCGPDAVLGEQEVQIREFPECDVAEELDCQSGAFHENCGNSDGGEQVEDREKFSGEEAVVGGDRLAGSLELGLVGFGEVCGVMLVKEGASPVEGGEVEEVAVVEWRSSRSVEDIQGFCV